MERPGTCNSQVVSSQVQPWTRITVRGPLPVDEEWISVPSTEAAGSGVSLLAPVEGLIVRVVKRQHSRLNACSHAYCVSENHGLIGLLLISRPHGQSFAIRIS